MKREIALDFRSILNSTMEFGAFRIPRKIYLLPFHPTAYYSKSAEAIVAAVVRPGPADMQPSGQPLIAQQSRR
jgi:hypothetical protein